ncbi:23S rRNA (uracil(1939)-C(5))-methyltransferase RlmD [Ferrovum sp. PN-J185]|uniref:23S rRNA (uracil(1939)-C(5))-methyltransferase RlmD n=1 Tax=Ferrovum sp. PN-J185 TaxID=1356306 RepID=UPI000792FF71|nr:23S rRNA (uracil(1939)-C(5))-methyltransferase RlmD [Ferrovum sp. PN-J185]KXW56201.1 23S rRNA (uracil(1939)-C(5))-methyltransferase RlmD [Ferrovum sp. PN-J185]MCC6067737.1 23S rRNA (uracil(1939)-C(5))-methyltransferase RlmD [Ferrovum sp. PN-J185]MDE1892245.1 23S rRNA (uracil(1939)-C(5))-methyltransferase RlmD [Betaproteobacteria bacterium]MDE2056843.1 23S rRNA (uracil(1939)-C(5))-methyltransferase RlmD [Betaproteobacteria bacterium]
MSDKLSLQRRIKTLQVESVDHEAMGIARLDGKVVFIDGALPNERVKAIITKEKPAFDLAQIDSVLSPSPTRTKPRCPHFGVCGGCNMQHAHADAQVAFKQRILEDNLERIGKVKSDTILPAIYGPEWGYRYRARLSVRYVEKKGGVLVGFHEKSSSFVADMHECHILPKHIGFLIDPLRELIQQLSIRDRLPQVELAVGEQVSILVFRILETPSAHDEELIKAFADTHQMVIWFQTKGPDSATPFYPLEFPRLTYSLPDFAVTMPFAPTEFTQVNPQVNRSLVSRALSFLDPRAGERIVDLFCGLGNFTLPIARAGASVLGVEGNPALIERAYQNAEFNGLRDSVEFKAMNLFTVTEDSFSELGRMDKLLIDPPRDGAVEVVKSLGRSRPQRVVYVSCNPSTLARDAQIMVHHQGYKLRAAGVVNMFPHTAHVESVAIFELA